MRWWDTYRGLPTVLAVCCFLSLTSCGLFLQEAGLKNYRLDERVQEKGLNDEQADFVHLARLLEIGFPQLDSVFPKHEREREQQAILAALAREHDPVSFVLQARRYLSHLHNQHTSIRLKNGFGRTRYPFEVFISRDQWFLLNIPKQQDSLLIGKRIVSLNGVPIAEVDERLRAYTFAENKINQQYELRSMALYSNPAYLRAAGVLREGDERLVLGLEGGRELRLSPVADAREAALHTITFPAHPLTRNQADKPYLCKVDTALRMGYLQFNHCHDSIDVIEGMQSYVKPWLQPTARAYLQGQFRKEKPSPRLRGYYLPEHPTFKRFLWEMVDSLNANGVEDLVIDLRGNPGGNLILGKQLLYFLTDREGLEGFKEYAFTSGIFKQYFTKEYEALEKAHGGRVPQGQLVRMDRDAGLFAEVTDPASLYHVPPDRPVFKGRVYLLANYRTGSAAAMLTTLFQDNGFGKVIGTSVGNNPTGATIWTPMELPRTKARISIATAYLVRPQVDRGKEQVPDIWVEYSVDDLVRGVDPYLEAAMEEIRAARQDR